MDAPDTLVLDLARRVFADGAAGRTTADGFDRGLWRTVRDTGLDQVFAAGDDGLPEAVGVLRLAGYHAVRVPLAETLMAVWLAQRTGFAVAGDCPVLAIAGLTAARSEAAAAAFADVPYGRHATALCVVDGDRVEIFAAPPERVATGLNVAGEPRDRVEYAAAGVRQALPAGTGEAIAGVAALFRAALMTGALERALELALDHARTRTQFGRPIGKFQAVQQMLAQLASEVAASSAAVDIGVQICAAGAAHLGGGIAKSRVSEAAGPATEIAHQVLGAMGFTSEHPLHLATTRLWAWRDEAGGAAYWNGILGERVREASVPDLWTFVESVGRAGTDGGR